MRGAFASLVALLLSVFSFAASNPVPLIYQPLIPTGVAPGHGAFTLTVHGVGFVSSSGGVAVSNDFNFGFNSNVELGDFTGDGNLDVALVSLDKEGNQLLNILLGNGKGAFTGPLTFPAGSSAVAPYNDDIDVADFNNDGMLDVVVGGPTQGIVLLQGTSK